MPRILLSLILHRPVEPAVDFLGDLARAGGLKPEVVVLGPDEIAFLHPVGLDERDHRQIHKEPEWLLQVLGESALPRLHLTGKGNRSPPDEISSGYCRRQAYTMHPGIHHSRGGTGGGVAGAIAGKRFLQRPGLRAHQPGPPGFRRDLCRKDVCREDGRSVGAADETAGSLLSLPGLT